MNISKYDILLKTIELGSLTKAADYYGYTQSAVSQVIHSLENDLGVVLLLRSRAGLSLTTEGRDLLPYIHEIVNSQNALSQRIDQFNNLQTGSLKIGTFHTLACNMLPALLKGFQKLYPLITFELIEGDFTELSNHLMTGRIDLAFLAIQGIRNFETIKLKKDPLYVILPPNHALADADVFPIEQLPKEPFIYLNEGNDNDSQLIWRATHTQPDIRYYAREDNTILAMIESGFGISILPESAIVRCPYNVVIKPTDPMYHRTIGIALKDKKHTTIAVREFIRYIKQIPTDQLIVHEPCIKTL